MLIPTNPVAPSIIVSHDDTVMPYNWAGEEDDPSNETVLSLHIREEVTHDTNGLLYWPASGEIIVWRWLDGHLSTNRTTLDDLACSYSAALRETLSADEMQRLISANHETVANDLCDANQCFADAWDENIPERFNPTNALHQRIYGAALCIAMRDRYAIQPA